MLVPDAAQRVAERCAADPGSRASPEWSRVCSAPPSARFTRVFDALWCCAAPGKV